ncbi:hypothetical protein PG994_003490 [Apiospora phragmitis]|uniref:Uncharacterized protein n=1 Tax=Apiospora phragmitis TaxID=2905665 RepID=A0ABR1W261_9PEZI
MSGNDSESEDRPRPILDLHGDFTTVDAFPHIAFKLDEIHTPSPSVQEAMGQGMSAPWAAASRTGGQGST